MSLIDYTYFTFDVNLPDNLVTSMTDYITRYEEEILIELLGYDLAQLCLNYTNASEQRIIDLVEGASYTESYNGTTLTVKWNGLKNTDKISLIAYYIYFRWLQNNASRTEIAGELRGLAENATVISSGMKAQQAWRQLKELYGYVGQDIYRPSAYNFLMHYLSTYPEWRFSELGSVNAFNL
jgi:hypothetical protein